jgi:hypothetical protein
MTATQLLAVIFTVTLLACLRCHADNLDTPNKLTLADLADYRSALSGDLTVDRARTATPPKQVRFRDLWNQPETFRGQRVVVQGRVVRIFRQGAVGTFPPLAEVWITSPAGDPFCVVFPLKELTVGDDAPEATLRREKMSQSQSHADTASSTPDMGSAVRFTGTFLKMVSYSASDGKRLAPLVVGNQPPLANRDNPTGDDPTQQRENTAQVFHRIGGSPSHARFDGWAWVPANWAVALVLAVLAGGIISWNHLRTPMRHHRPVGQNPLLPRGDDRPPEFISSDSEP